MLTKEETEESNITTIQLHKVPTKNRLNRFKIYLKTDFDKVLNGFMDLINKYKLRKDLKDIVEEKKNG